MDTIKNINPKKYLESKHKEFIQLIPQDCDIYLYDNKVNFKLDPVLHRGIEMANDFLHISSLSPKDYNSEYMFCSNTAFPFACENPHEFYLSGKKRYECLYRANKSAMAIDLINKANNLRENSNIKVWRVREDTRLINTYIRYTDKSEYEDFIVILREKFVKKTFETKWYYFVTAYPIFMKRSKDEFDKSYDRYFKSIGRGRTLYDKIEQ
jgi:hypothetical protein